MEAILINVDKTLSNEDLLKLINADTPIANYTRRFYLKGTKTAIKKVAVSFKTNEQKRTALQHGLLINDIIHRLEPLRRRNEPTQCHNCQKFGHIASACKSEKTCLRCGGRHPLSQCLTPREKPKCANCQGPHIASYRGCLTFKKLASKTSHVRIPPTTKEPYKPTITSTPPTYADASTSTEDLAIPDQEPLHIEASTSTSDLQDFIMESQTTPDQEPPYERSPSPPSSPVSIPSSPRTHSFDILIEEKQRRSAEFHESYKREAAERAAADIARAERATARAAEVLATSIARRATRASYRNNPHHQH